eukprot:902179-Rhodomonas_salina.1
MSENKIDAFETGIFAGLSKLEEIRIQSQDHWLRGVGGLQTISDTLFQDLVSLREVRMSDIGLMGTLRSELFANTPNLVVFDASRNELAGIEAGAFAGLAKLERIFLFDNKIAGTLAKGTFAGCSSLKLLYLGQNGLHSLDAGVFHGLTTLEELKMGEQSLGLGFGHELDDALFQDLTSVKVLAMFGMGFTGSLRKTQFEDMSSLEKLQAQRNAFDRVEEGAWSGLTNLSSVHLWENAIGGTLPSAFDGCKSLAELNMRNNHITGLEKNALSGLGSLVDLSLGYNYIEGTIPQGFCEGCDSLVHLSLEFNRITYVDVEGLVWLTELETVELFGNPLTCIPRLWDSKATVVLFSYDIDRWDFCLPKGCFTSMDESLVQSGKNDTSPVRWGALQILRTARRDVVRELDSAFVESG